MCPHPRKFGATTRLQYVLEHVGFDSKFFFLYYARKSVKCYKLTLTKTEIALLYTAIPFRKKITLYPFKQNKNERLYWKIITIDKKYYIFFNYSNEAREYLKKTILMKYEKCLTGPKIDENSSKQ